MKQRLKQQEEDSCRTTLSFSPDQLIGYITPETASTNCKASQIDANDVAWLNAPSFNIFQVKEVPNATVVINLRQNLLTSLTISSKVQLRILKIDENPIESFRDLSLPQENLQSLSVIKTKITTLDGLNYPFLTSLFISSTGITSLEGINTSRLEKLDVSSTSLKSFKGGEKLELKELVWNDKQGRLEDQVVVPKAVQVNMSNNPGIEFDYIKLRATTLLILQNNAMSSLGRIFFSKSISTLTATNNTLTSFPHLKGYKVLEFIDLSDNQITTFANITLPTRLASLFLNNNQITRIYGVVFPDTMQTLSLGQNHLVEFEIASKFLPILSKADITLPKMDTDSIKCSNSKAIVKTINVTYEDKTTGTFPLCMIPDEEFDEFYSTALAQEPDFPLGPESDPNVTEASGSSSNGIYIGIISALSVLITVVMWLVWRRRRTVSSNPVNGPEENSNITKGSTSTVTMELSTSMDAEEILAEYEKMKTNHRADGIWSDPGIMAARIPLEKVEMKRLLAQGTKREVYKGTYRHRKVAIKKLLPYLKNSIKQIESLMLEVKILVSMQHPQIVSFIGVAWNALTDLCVVEELMERGSLRSILDQLQKAGSNELVVPQKLKIARQIALGLTYIHSLAPKLIHRDLKCRNVLLNTQMEAKLTGFSVARELLDEEDTTTSSSKLISHVGSGLWMAPELIMGKKCCEKADMFSFGIVMIEIDTLRLPYASVGLTESMILQKVVSDEMTARFSNASASVMDPAFYELGHQCLSLDPDKRPTAMEVSFKLMKMIKSLAQ